MEGVWMQGWIGGPAVAAFTATALAFATPALAQSHWDPVAGALPATHAARGGHPAGRLSRVHARPGGSEGGPVDGARGRAAQPRGRRAVGHGRSRCPRRTAGLQRFAIKESPIMEDGLAAAHPEIKTYAGVGIDDPTATLRADTTPLGFHASVRSAKGAWYIDPVLPPRHERLRQLLRAATSSRTASARPRARRCCAEDSLATVGAPRRPPGRTSSCAPTGWRSSPTRPTPPTSAPPTSPRPRSR